MENGDHGPSGPKCRTSTPRPVDSAQDSYPTSRFEVAWCRFRGAKFLPQSSSCLETAEIFRGVLREVVAGPTKIKSHHSSFEHNSNAFPSPAGVDEPRDALLALSHVSRRGQSGHGQQ